MALTFQIKGSISFRQCLEGKKEKWDGGFSEELKPYLTWLHNRKKGIEFGGNKDMDEYFKKPKR